MEDYPLVNKEYEKFFTSGVFPGRTCIAVKGLPLNGLFFYDFYVFFLFFKAKIEIEMVAVQNS